MAEYFLPDVENLWAMDCSYRMRWLGPEDFRELYRPEWSNALCADRKHLDVLGRISEVCGSDEDTDALVAQADAEAIYRKFNGLE